jgi:hypothetical protein
MSESETLARFTGRLAEERFSSDAPAELVACDDLRSFGWLRGIRETAPMLELRKKTGNIVAIGYAWLEGVEFDPSEGILLDVGDRRILIRGRNLNAEIRPGVRLFEGVTRHRVPWIREIDAVQAMGADESACVVDSISW